MDEFVDAYSLTTGIKHRIPRIWLDDPVLGRDFRRTPAQRELDGDLGPRPNTDSTVEEIDAYADAADIDLKGIKLKDDKVAAIEDVFVHSEVQAGVVDIDPEPPVADPLDPKVVALVDHPAAQPTPTSTDGTEPTDETPAAGDEEN